MKSEVVKSALIASLSAATKAGYNHAVLEVLEFLGKNDIDNSVLLNHLLDMLCKKDTIDWQMVAQKADEIKSQGRADGSSTGS